MAICYVNLYTLHSKMNGYYIVGQWYKAAAIIFANYPRATIYGAHNTLLTQNRR